MLCLNSASRSCSVPDCVEARRCWASYGGIPSEPLLPIQELYACPPITRGWIGDPEPTGDPREGLCLTVERCSNDLWWVRLGGTVLRRASTGDRLLAAFGRRVPLDAPAHPTFVPAAG